MSRWNKFTFRINDEEEGMLKTLASNLHRSQSDTIRYLIFRAMNEIVTTKQIAVPDNLGQGTGPARLCAPPFQEDTL
jgi:predicted transcriptional regulator